MDRKEFINQAQMLCKKEDFEQNIGLLENVDCSFEHLLKCFRVGMEIEQSLNLLSLITLTILPSTRLSFGTILHNILNSYNQQNK